ncbi:hypothetical protein, conserved [Eimeria tenella]|uniref:Uncharacterized protein n=1 Tax=Eimeria tenella TaxID=5802 RepID=U6L7Q4_EIMTE|nr:hypothetical protein, conserved [Eimeria tenella]CDJ44599.1 hypothetical protein, conserved [Eimeria tenella]|eukprot:XP_013235347.1 hypothetical protein, conserved [Eimeria tenella]
MLGSGLSNFQLQGGPSVYLGGPLGLFSPGRLRAALELVQQREAFGLQQGAAAAAAASRAAANWTVEGLLDQYAELWATQLHLAMQKAAVKEAAEATAKQLAAAGAPEPTLVLATFLL